ncbi:hypothetical protein [Duganella sp. Root1480D1]|uniref:hypothetical protein n=1 Tax=Duganella sp. Root1480D1 TaxID=1736471 RepID=UPI00070C3A6A|nr:hypothetical protein [Duganella sp. Root1480D1]KQZ34269.1 hypothetical protein ASD58_28770 [Duganella sp. Root1480D1]
MAMVERWRELSKPLGAAPEVSWTAAGTRLELPRGIEITGTLLPLITVLLWISLNVMRIFNNA